MDKDRIINLLLGDHPKTTINGLKAGAVAIAYDVFDAVISGSLSGKHGGILLGSIGLIIIGRIMKDRKSDKDNGTAQ